MSSLTGLKVFKAVDEETGWVIIYSHKNTQWKHDTRAARTTRGLKVIDKVLRILMRSREILAISRWQFPHSLTEEQKSEKEKLQKDSPAKPEGYNHELDKEVTAALDKIRGKWVDDRKDFGKSQTSHTQPYPFTQIQKSHNHPQHH